MASLTLNRRRGIQTVVCILLFAFILRLCVGMLYSNYFDITWYRTWAVGFQNGFFDAYARLNTGKYALDYPPLYLYCLYIVGQLYGQLPIADYWMFDMLAMKFFPILFDVLAAGLFYLVCRKQSEALGVLAAALWALNPSAIFNSSHWGQTDGLMVFLLLLSFYQVERGKDLLGSILFAVACLTKMQCLYFAPVLFVYLLRPAETMPDGSDPPAKESLFSYLRRCRWIETLSCVGAALLTGIAGFVPFIAGSWKLQGAESLLLPFKVYFGGLGKYPYATLNAFNLYGSASLNWVKDNRSILFGNGRDSSGFATGGITLHHFGTLMLFLSLVLVIYIMLHGKRENRLWAGCFLFMQCVFMLTTRMHERYQFPVLLFSLMLFLRQMDFRWLMQYLALSLMTFFNQFLLLVRHNTINDPKAPWDTIYTPVMTVMSFVNLAIFLWGVMLTVSTAFPPARREDGPVSEPVPDADAAPDYPKAERRDEA